MKRMHRFLWLIVLSTVVTVSLGQKAREHYHTEFFTPEKPIICYAGGAHSLTSIPAPKEYLEQKKAGARAQTAEIIVTYEGFTTEAQQAFQAAVDIWETLISSPVPIRVRARWVGLGDGVLGSASPATYTRNFPEAQKLGVWYPIALAEKMARRELNSASDFDIVASFSSSANWYYGLGTITAVQYDLTTVVLHEIGHGLGMTKSYEVSNSNGQVVSFFDGSPVLYDSFLENINGQNLVGNFASPSTDLGTQLTGGNLFFNSKLVLSRNSNNRAKIYAPSTFSSGSSIAHLDENTFDRGNSNSLMTPFIGRQEIIHNPGNIAMAIFKDMGWKDISINHNGLPNTENTNNDFPVVCTIDNDTAYDASSVKLHYTFDGTTFTTLTMQPTGNVKEYKAVLPKPANASTVTSYEYYISVEDVAQRTYRRPGIIYRQGSTTTQQQLFILEAGPDIRAPKITHSPVSFIKISDTSLPLTAVLTDNIGISEAMVEYSKNDGPLSTLNMTNSADSTFVATISLSLAAGDKIKYRIKVTDQAVAKNIRISPATGFHEVNVVSLKPTQDSYTNNFNSPTSDFFGDSQFSITTPSGFADPAIHSVHPYPNGTGAGFESNFVYQLSIPIRLKSTDAFLKFDEIVLVEPGETGAAFGTDDFFDYVVVEASKDGGVSWKILANGYDAADKPEWLARWNSSKDNSDPTNSTGAGVPSLFRTRTINMLATTNFKAGDEIVIRFRLFADQLVHGWGWAIDNLRIQLDDTPPVIKHNHVDFLAANAPKLSLTANVTDGSGIQDLTFEYGVNGGATTQTLANIAEDVSQYTLDIALNGLKGGDEIQYRIKSRDKIGNEAILPASGFYKVPLLDFSSTINSYTSDFNSPNTDFAGNYFGIGTATGFENGSINSEHPYPIGFGLNGTSEFTYMLKKPIVISSTNPFILFREVLIAEYENLTTVRDYAAVEASKDNGMTWEKLLDNYSSNVHQDWRAAPETNANGNPANYKTRLIAITQNGKFKAGDVILLRFRLFSDNVTNRWGWAIDDLSIQGIVTSLEKSLEQTVEIFPNPTSGEIINISASGLSSQEAHISIINSQGGGMATQLIPVVEGSFFQPFSVVSWAAGMYFIKVQAGDQLVVKKFIKTN